MKTRPLTSHCHRHPHPGLRALSLGPGAEDCGQPAFGLGSLFKGARQGPRRTESGSKTGSRGARRCGAHSLTRSAKVDSSGSQSAPPHRSALGRPTAGDPAGPGSVPVRLPAPGCGRRPAARPRGDASSAPGSATPWPRGGEGRGKGTPLSQDTHSSLQPFREVGSPLGLAASPRAKELLSSRPKGRLDLP